jgi:hypothetical protein
MDKINTDQLAICPSCGAAMHFSRIVPSIDGLPEMQTFECRPCQLAITAGQVLGRATETAAYLHKTPCIRFEIGRLSGRLKVD